jgi:hypothetical protein
MKNEKRYLKREEMENFGSIITVKKSLFTDQSHDYCLGNLMNFPGHGVFDAHWGKVDVTPEEADAHNAALDKAFIAGLDANCEIGMMGTFYYDGKKNIVHTFNGTLVAAARVVGKTITFVRGGKLFRGRLQKNADCFNFKRIK